MVMHVQVCQESSFFSVDDSINVVLLERDDRDELLEVEVQDLSCYLSTPAARDTSTLGRESMDCSRQTFNTQISILDLTKDEEGEDDDDDDDDGSVLFHDLHDTDPRRLHEDALDPSSHNDPDAAFIMDDAEHDVQDEKKTSSGGLLGRFSPDHFFDSICSPNSSAVNESICSRSSRKSRLSCSSSTSCMVIPCTSPSQGVSSQVDDRVLETSSQHSRTSPKLKPIPVVPMTPAEDRLQVENDVWNLLGCASPPDVMELESIWHLTTTARDKSSSGKSSSSEQDGQRKRFVRASLKDRMQRIHRLQQERWSGATRHGITLSQHGPYSPSISLRAVSMDNLESKDYSRWNDNSIDVSSASWAAAMGFTSSNGNSSASTLVSGNQRRSRPHDLNQHCYSSNVSNGMLISDGFNHATDGYDSDPEFSTNPAAFSVSLLGTNDHFDGEDKLTSISSTSIRPGENSSGSRSRVLVDQQHHSLPRVENEVDQLYTHSEDQDYFIYQTVQQTLNSTWTLTWHPNLDNAKEFHIPSKPFMINIWMERGTVITHSGVVIEPMFMWRDAYQSHYLLQQRKRLNPTCQKPWSMRLLNTCRIAPCDQVSHLDRNKYPLARKANCLMVKTCLGQEFLLEAKSASQMDLICERWKITVARFASLAVTEDIDAIAQEFFHPTLSAQTLTVQQQKQQQQEEELVQMHDSSMVVSSSDSSSSSTEDSQVMMSASSSSSSSAKVSMSTSTTSNRPSPLVATPPVATPANGTTSDRRRATPPVTTTVSGTTSHGRRWSDI